MAVYSSSPSQDLTAAWYAAAPPPPPPQSRTQQQKRASMVAVPTQNQYSGQGYGQQNDRVRTSSSSTSLSFDKRVIGDDLPRDSHSPAPERPVSRNAMAKQRERERQRARTNSTSNYSQSVDAASGPDNVYPYDYGQQSQHLQMAATIPNRSPSPGPRIRRESSPAAPGVYSAYHQDQQGPVIAIAPTTVSYDTAQSPAFQLTHQAHNHVQAIAKMPQQSVMAPAHPWSPFQTAPSPMHPPPNPTFTPQQYGQPAEIQYTQPPIQMHPQQNVYPVGYVSAPQTPSQYSQGYWPHPSGQQPVYAAEPVSMPQTPIYGGTPVMPASVIMQQSTTPQAFAVPFPTSSAMPPPPVPYVQQAVQQTAYPVGVYNTPPTAHGRPLPSPSRTSSQSSSVDTRASTTSLGSASGIIRRTLPQPPQDRSDSNPQQGIRKTMVHTAVRQSDTPASLGRHESVRMAAEEIMSRGLPNRRKGLPFSSRTQSSGSSTSHTHANSSRSDGSITDGTLPGIGPVRSTPPVVVNQRHRAESASCLENEMRALKLNKNGDEAFGAPSTREPLSTIQPSEMNNNKRSSVPVPEWNVPVRASSPRPIRAAPTPAPEVTIASPVEEIIPRRPLSRGPKDERERKRSMDAQAAASTPRPPSIQVSETPAIPVFTFDEPEEIKSSVPTIIVPGDEDVSGPPGTCISNGDETEKPTGTISISVSSSGIAQRSTSSNDLGNANNNQNHRSNELARQRTASKPFMVPEPASAPSIGSGAGCASCQKWIGGRVVHAMNHTFHPDCFVCSHCSEALEHVAFYEHEGQPYCHFDFHELFSKRCFHCRTPIVDQRYITINDVELVGGGGENGQEPGETQERCYHDMHFFCANCGDPFLDPKLASSAAGGQNEILAEIEDDNGTVRYGGREFVVHKGYPYCENCHISLHKPKCKGCKKPIIDEEYLTALRGKWHIGCFCCIRCQVPIESDNFFVRDGQAYDEECYKIKLRSEL